MNRSPTPDGVFVAHFTDCSLDISCVFVGLSQSVRNVLADRSQCNGKPQAAVGDRFIVPAYTYSPRILWADVALLTIRSQRFGNPFAA